MPLPRSLAFLTTLAPLLGTALLALAAGPAAAQKTQLLVYTALEETRIRRCWPAAAIVRTVCAASINDASDRSSEYANAVFSPATARTAHTLVDAEAAALDDALLERPALVTRGLEVQIGVVDAVLADGRKGARHRRLGQAERGQEQRLGNGQSFEGGFARDHGPF